MKEKNKNFAENTVSESPGLPAALPALPEVETTAHDRATPEAWSAIKADYLIGKGSMRGLAARHGVSESTLMKRAVREHWASQRALASSTADATVVTTMQERAANFVNRSAEQTDRFLTRISESEAIIQPEDRQGLRQLAATLKDVVAVGRDTFQLGNRDEGNRCIVNLGFLNDYKPPRDDSFDGSSRRDAPVVKVSN